MASAFRLTFAQPLCCSKVYATKSSVGRRAGGCKKSCESMRKARRIRDALSIPNEEHHVRCDQRMPLHWSGRVDYLLRLEVPIDAKDDG